MIPTLLQLLKLSILALIFAVGLRSTPEILAYFWRRPAQLLRALLAIYVVVPVLASRSHEK